MFNKIIEEVKISKREYEDKTKNAVSVCFKDFMTKHPEVKRMTWTQYTPSFNDGDPCVFSLNEVFFVAEEPDDADERSVYDWDDYNLIWYTGTYHPEEKKYLASEELKTDINSIESFMKDNESMMQSVFGDGVCVTIMPDGTSKIDKYYHD